MASVARELAATIIAIAIVIAYLLVILFDVVNGHEVKIPPELAFPSSLIVGFFFGQHAVTNGAANARETAAATAAAINGEHDATVRKPLP